jgi:hypothetical protein
MTHSSSLLLQAFLFPYSKHQKHYQKFSSIQTNTIFDLTKDKSYQVYSFCHLYKDEYILCILYLLVIQIKLSNTNNAICGIGDLHLVLFPILGSIGEELR